MDLMASAGIDHPDKVDRSVVSTRVIVGKTQTFEEIYPEIKTGSLLDGSTVPNELFKVWKKASVDKF